MTGFPVTPYAGARHSPNLPVPLLVALAALTPTSGGRAMISRGMRDRKFGWLHSATALRSNDRIFCGSCLAFATPLDRLQHADPEKLAAKYGISPAHAAGYLRLQRGW